jgi:hypothetical protein
METENNDVKYLSEVSIIKKVSGDNTTSYYKDKKKYIY